MPGTSEMLHLAELLCSRLCHDLSGPLGALVGIIELAREEQAEGETLGLAEETANELGQRLRLLRAAWGPYSEPLDLAQLQAYANCLNSSRRLQLDLTGVPQGLVFQPPAGRIVLNLLLLAAESLPRGGVVALAGATERQLLVSITGTRAAWPAGLAACLAADEAIWQALTSPRSLQAPLTVLIARSQGVGLSLLMPGGPSDAPPSPLLATFGSHTSGPHE